MKLFERHDFETVLFQAVSRNKIFSSPQKSISQTAAAAWTGTVVAGNSMAESFAAVLTDADALLAVKKQNIVSDGNPMHNESS